MPTPDIVWIERRAFDADVLAHLRHDARVGLLALDPSTRRRIRVTGHATFEGDAVLIQVAETFGNCQQYVQKRPAEGPEPTQTRSVASGDAFNALHRQWIRQADTCFIASLHPVAGPDASHRGGRTGFVEVLDARTLRFADYHGNQMFQTLGNLTTNPQAAMLFVDFETGRTLQLTGTTEVQWDADDSPTGRALWFVVHARVEKQPVQPWRWPVLEYSPVNP